MLSLTPSRVMIFIFGKVIFFGLSAKTVTSPSCPSTTSRAHDREISRLLKNMFREHSFLFSYFADACLINYVIDIKY